MIKILQLLYNQKNLNIQDYFLITFKIKAIKNLSLKLKDPKKHLLPQIKLQITQEIIQLILREYYILWVSFGFGIAFQLWAYHYYKGVNFTSFVPLPMIIYIQNVNMNKPVEISKQKNYLYSQEIILYQNSIQYVIDHIQWHGYLLQFIFLILYQDLFFLI